MVLRTAILAGLLGFVKVASAVPLHVAVTAPSHVEMLRSGQPSGKISLTVGTVLDLEGVEGEFLLVHIRLLKGRVPIKDTNYMALISAEQDVPSKRAAPTVGQSALPPADANTPSPQIANAGTAATVTWADDRDTSSPTREAIELGWAMFGTTFLFVMAFMVIMIVAHWRIYAKAGKPGWASLVPIYNLIVYLRIAGKPLWWLALYLVPLVNIVVAIMCVFALAQKFGKGKGFALGMVLLPFIFNPILAFSDAHYAA